ncbi:hypothetical protein ACIJYF_00750 [Candidatus Pelagibacter bacterium nBUS_49]|uniref:hypothetical protein n=1 Tax=Candidatus Pelagibacter bacterium nBUS_49 TaxID=3374196 RepID=UPI003EBD554C
MLERFKNILNRFITYLVISSYLPKNLFLSKSFSNVPLIFKFIRFFINKRINPSTKKMKNENINILKRKRKVLLLDDLNELVIHSFFFPFDKNLYNKTREEIVKQFRSKKICNTDYVSEQFFGKTLLVTERKISGSVLTNCEQRVIEKFLNYLAEDLLVDENCKQDEGVYTTLHNTFIKLKKKLSKESKFHKLSQLCNDPFDNKQGLWPSQYCHGQILPNNVISSNTNNDQFYLIDFEPKLMGKGPYAYDLIFFILYSSDLISAKYKNNLIKTFFNPTKKHLWCKNFLAQIIWWSRNKVLNSNQIFKIELRSSIVLDLINNDIE